MTAEDKIKSRIKVASTKFFITKTPEDGVRIFNAHTELIKVFEKNSVDRMTTVLGMCSAPIWEHKLNTFQTAKQYGIVIQAKA